MYLPAVVPEVSPDLANNARLGVGAQAGADRRVEVIDGLEQTHVADLHQVLPRLRTALVSLYAGPDQRLVPLQKQLAGRVPDLTAARQRPDHVHELKAAAARKRARRPRPTENILHP